MIIPATARNALLSAYIALLTNVAKLRLRTAGGAEVANIILPNPAFGTPVNGVSNIGTVTADTDANGGTIADAVFLNATDVVQGTMSVGTSNAEVVLSSLTIPAGATVTVSSFTLTMPAGT